MKQKIILYASVGNNVPSYLIGGGETGTRRTIQILKNAGYETEIVDKAILGLGLKHYINMIIQAFFKTLKNLRSDKNAYMFVVGYYERNLWFEWLLLTMAHILNHKYIYEARNGRLVNAFNERGMVYQYFMLSLLKRADVVLCQGQEYVDFIKERLQKETVYIPNYVMDDKLRPYSSKSFETGVNLIYSGRLVESKNLSVIIHVAAILKERGLQVWLTLLGGGQEEYLERLKKQIDDLRLYENVTFLGHVNFDEATKYLEEAHFFLFPSQEIKEGHSNSLTEAMAFGIVPIVSTAGFSASIVNNSDLVIREISAVKYADKVIEIIESGKWKTYSYDVYQRVIEYYTESRVKEKLLDAFKSLQ